MTGKDKDNPSLVRPDGAKFQDRVSYLGLGKKELKERSGLDEKTLTKIECGDPVRRDSLRKAAKSVGMHYEDLILRPPREAPERDELSEFREAVDTLHRLTGSMLRRFHHQETSPFWEFPGGNAFIVRSKAKLDQDLDNEGIRVWMGDLFSSMAVEVISGVLRNKVPLAHEAIILGSNSDLPAQILQENLVFVGGTLGNPVCMMVCKDYEETSGHRLPHYWHGQEVPGERVLESEEPKQEYATTNHGHDRITDFGLVLKMPNPRNGERWVYVLAGNLGVGTYAAARFVASERGLSEIDESWQGKGLSFVVEGRAEGYSLILDPQRVTDVQEVRRP